VFEFEGVIEFDSIFIGVEVVGVIICVIWVDLEGDFCEVRRSYDWEGDD